MHLVDAFIQSDLQAIYFFISMCVLWELNPRSFALLTQCSTTEPQEHVLLITHVMVGYFGHLCVWESFIICLIQNSSISGHRTLQSLYSYLDIDSSLDFETQPNALQWPSSSEDICSLFICLISHILSVLDFLKKKYIYIYIKISGKYFSVIYFLSTFLLGLHRIYLFIHSFIHF